MAQKIQSTSLHRNFVLVLDRLETWAINPWRKYSLLLIILLIGFLLGSSIGMINGVLALMDPIGAFFTVLFLEALVRIRRGWPMNKRSDISLQLIDSLRIGLLYGLLLEGFKLL